MEEIFDYKIIEDRKIMNDRSRDDDIYDQTSEYLLILADRKILTNGNHFFTFYATINYKNILYHNYFEGYEYELRNTASPNICTLYLRPIINKNIRSMTDMLVYVYRPQKVILELEMKKEDLPIKIVGTRSHMVNTNFALILSENSTEQKISQSFSEPFSHSVGREDTYEKEQLTCQKYQVKYIKDTNYLFYYGIRNKEKEIDFGEKLIKLENKEYALEMKGGYKLLAIRTNYFQIFKSDEKEYLHSLIRWNLGKFCQEDCHLISINLVYVDENGYISRNISSFEKKI